MDGPPAPSTRVLIFSGKGGTGKTTMAAATGLRTAALGHRTLILSVDIAHSLADSFDVAEAIREHPKGMPYAVAERLEIQELDVQEEMFRHWDEVFRYFSVLFTQAGMDDVIAEELAIIPGMEDVIALLYLNEYVRDDRYDVIVLDLAPTGESLRFIAMPNTLDWYMRKVFRFERNLARLARPIAKHMAHLPVPDDSYFDEIERLWRRMDGVDKVLLDPAMTTVRLVTNAEQMVVRESERAYMYFSLYGVAVDQVIVNKVIAADTDSLPPAFRDWARTHQKNLTRIRRSFHGLRIDSVPLAHDEVVGTARLEAVAAALYGPLAGGNDPAAHHPTQAPFRYHSEGDHTTLELYLPNLDRDDLDLYVEDTELIVRIGSHKRHIPLPRRLRERRPELARYESNMLTVVFKTQAPDTPTPAPPGGHT